LADGLHSQISYRMPLMLQHLAPGLAVLSWELDRPAQGLLYAFPGDSQSPALALPIDPSAGRQVLVMEGLRPGGLYGFELGLMDADGGRRPPALRGEPWGPLEVGIPPEGREVVRVGVLGDSGYGQTLTRDLAVRLLAEEPDLVIHTGDLVYFADRHPDPYDAYQQKYFLPLAPLLRRVPIYAVPGNHELDGGAWWEGRPMFEHVFPPLKAAGFERLAAQGGGRWGALELGDWQILFLDSNVLLGQPGREEQRAWLEARLADGRFRGTIAVFHIPPYTSGLHTHDGSAIRHEWLPLFDRGNVALVISGHDHNYERLQRDGRVYLVSGGGSSALYPLKERLESSRAFHARSHFVLLELSGQGISISAIAADGTVLDETFVPAVR
jgi:hypothetical protein